MIDQPGFVLKYYLIHKQVIWIDILTILIKGSINFNFSTRFWSSILHKNIQIKRTLNRLIDEYLLGAESFFNVATNIKEMDAIPATTKMIIESYNGKSFHEQSRG